MLRRIPPAFYDDHVARDLPAPALVKRGRLGVYWIDDQDPALADLRADAEHYASPSGPDECR